MDAEKNDAAVVVIRDAVVAVAAKTGALLFGTIPEIIPAVLFYGSSFFFYSAAIITENAVEMDADVEMAWIPAGSLSFFYSSVADAAVITVSVSKDLQQNRQGITSFACFVLFFSSFSFLPVLFLFFVFDIPNPFHKNYFYHEPIYISLLS